MSIEEIKRDIREHVKCNIKKFGRQYSHVFFKCVYGGVEYRSATIRPNTAVNLLTNKIFFHTVTKQIKNQAQ